MERYSIHEESNSSFFSSQMRTREGSRRRRAITFRQARSLPEIESRN